MNLSLFKNLAKYGEGGHLGVYHKANVTYGRRLLRRSAESNSPLNKTKTFHNTAVDHKCCDIFPRANGGLHHIIGLQKKQPEPPAVSKPRGDEPG